MRLRKAQVHAAAQITHALAAKAEAADAAAVTFEDYASSMAAPIASANASGCGFRQACSRDGGTGLERVWFPRMCDDRGRAPTLLR